MGKTLVFHIGTPKTGTTSIQAFLDGNRKALEEKGICYPDTRRFCLEQGIDIGSAVNNVQNGGFFEQFIPLGVKKVKMDQLLQNQDFKKILDFIISCLERYKLVILSDESMWLRDITELLQYFASKDISIQVVVYFRNQVDYIESFWKHDIKMGLFAGDFSTFWELRKASAVVESMYYYRKISEIEKVISKQNITARLYNPNRHRENINWLLEDFMETIGETLTSDYKTNRGYENVSLFGSALILKNRFNELGIDDSRGSFRQLFSQMSKQLAMENPSIKNTTFLSQEMIQGLINEFSDENDMLKQAYFVNEQEILFDVFSKETIHEEISEFDEAIFHFIITYMQNEIALLSDMNTRINDIMNRLPPN